jgi:predicted neuraminidase
VINVLDLPADGLIRRTTSDPDRFEAFTPSPCVQNHAANLTLLANGDLGCVWFGGTQEGMADISIWFARLAKESSEWSQPIKLSDDPARSKQNPILFPAPDETLWLLWTAQISGNQNTAVVRKRTSSDNGHSWSPVETLFAGSRTFVRQPLVVLDNGDWLLPVFNCPSAPGRRWNRDDDTSSVKISSDGGLTWRDIEVPGSNGCVHMNKAQLADGSLLALFRSRWADNINESRSNDRGRTWSVPIKTTLHNNTVHAPDEWAPRARFQRQQRCKRDRAARLAL